MPWYLYLALKQLFPTGKKFPFFTAISILGVALGVAVLVISTSVMSGFGREIRRWTVDTTGDVQVRGEGPVDRPADVLARITRVSGVVAATPFAEGVVMLEHGLTPAYPAIEGIDVDHVTGVIPLEQYIHYGSLANLDDDSIIVSSQLALKVGARVGDKVELYSPLLIERLKNDEVTLGRELKIVGIFEIGHQALDSSIVLVTLRTMQDLYGRRGAVDGFNVKIEPGLDADTAASRLNAALPPSLHARSWMEINHDLIFILQLEQNMIFFLLTFIIIVAAFSVTSSLLISVVRKTREIGMLGALGGRPRQVAACFCFQGFLIGVGGTAVGMALGRVILYFRDDLIAAFTRITQSEAALERFYQFRQLPAYYSPAYMRAIVICTIVISTLAGLLPAWRAARLKPVEALRSE
ncbi:MAG TPA: ABC transporter permease [Opitutaceae bacterium]|nr:ABC transporter permease [Opitutaceae bacterium]